jgi:curved DNA-binding protein CbpA
VRALSEQDHYEILEIASDATGEEIERAYRMTMATYADDSLAGYSVFSEGDTEALRERIEIAHRVLSNRESRREYDASLGVIPVSEEPEPLEAPEAAAISEPPSAHESATPPVTELDESDDSNGDFDGSRLKRLRMRNGLEIEDIAGVTKISPTYLRFIEEDRFQELPHRVYVHGFVTAYATCIGLDSKQVTSSYMDRFDEGRKAPRRGRFFEGR